MDVDPSAIGRVLAGTRPLRMGIALLVIVGLVGVATLQVLPLSDRKATIQAGEPVNATITTAEYRTENPRRANPSYFATVEYEYTVDGRTYTSDRIFPGPELSQPYRDSDLVPHYEPGQQVQAHYDPSDPQTAWLTTAKSRVSTRTGQVALVGTLVSILVGYLSAEWYVARAPSHAHGNSAVGIVARVGRYAGAMLRGVMVAAVCTALSYAIGIGLGIWFTVG